MNPPKCEIQQRNPVKYMIFRKLINRVHFARYNIDKLSINDPIVDEIASKIMSLTMLQSIQLCKTLKVKFH